ncbi:MAG: right-handed parallel beta-helix repeat-containing protein [Actinomycetota bacterium]|nr:right-handed parallel beta-helix repeat-containing protein [Actinomycetota bacterium]
MRRAIASLALSATALLLASAPAAAFIGEGAGATTTASPAPVLPTAAVDPATLPADPTVVTDEQLTAAGAAPAVLQLVEDPNLLIVDDDRAQCPNAEFTTPAGIQLAIEAAAPGDKIRVCPGTYTPIDVHKADLWLQAPRTQGSANQCQDGNPAQNAIVTGSTPTGVVRISAAGVRFEGFTVQGNADGPGIRTEPTGSGYELAFNDVRLNRYGVDLSTNGLAPTAVRHNCIRDNTTGTPATSSGILSSAGFSNVLIEENFFSGHRCVAVSNLHPADAPACIQVAAIPATNVTFSHNSLVDDTTASFQNATDVDITYNEWVAHFGAAVALTRVVGANVSFNHVDGEGNASQGFFVSGDTGVALNTVVKSNKIENNQGGTTGTFQFFGSGIQVNGAGVTVLENWIQFNRGSGIRLAQLADGNVVRGNLLVGNGVPGTDALNRNGADGIRIELGAVGNTIENNRLGEALQGTDPEERANRDHDCHDNNPQGANVWRHNVGYTENQPGLCVRRA